MFAFNKLIICVLIIKPNMTADAIVILHPKRKKNAFRATYIILHV